MLELNLPAEIEDRLDLLTLGSGQSQQFFVMEAILEYLDEKERRQLELETKASRQPEDR